tara:strand:- start:440 stop:664 length:225 start_codon:yes stop_codon:yes gene_type:complete
MKNKEIIVKVGKKVELEREKKGLSREKFADEVGLSRMQVYRIEEGKSNPTLDTLLEICRVLDIKITELLEFNNS